MLCALFYFLPPTQNVYAAENVPVKISTHGDILRFSFEFPQLTAYRTEKKDNSVQITFKTPMTLSFPKGTPKAVRDIWSAKTDPKTADVKIEMKKMPKRVKDYRVLRRIVLDITPGSKPAPKKPIIAEKPEPKPVEVATAPVEEVSDQTQPPVKDLDNTPETPGIDEGIDVTEDINALAQKKIEAKLPTDDENLITDQMPAPAVQPPLVDEIPLNGNTNTASNNLPLDPTYIKVTSVEPTNLAVFKRFNALWIVMDTQSTGVSAPIVTGPLSDELGGGRLLKFDGGTAYRYKLPDGAYISVKKKKMSWEVSLTASAIQPMSSQTLRIENDPASDHAKLILPIDGDQRVFEIVDPDAGDKINVITSASPTSRIDQARTFPDVHILPAAIGFAGVVLSDDIRLNRISDFLLITSKNGVAATYSPLPSSTFVNNPDDDSSEHPSKRGVKRLFDFPSWWQGGIASLNTNRRALEAQMAIAPDQDAKNQLLMRMALLYFANNFGHETLGALRAVEQTDPEIAKNMNFIALRGAASAMAGQYDEALKYLSTPAIQKHPEVKLWIGYAAAATEQWTKANRMFPDNSMLLGEYPEDIAIPFTIYMAESALRLGRTDTAQSLLNSFDLMSTNLKPNHTAAVLYLKGEVARQEGRYDDALKLWKPAAEGLDRLYHAKASLAKALLELKEGRISPDDAINDIDSLRFAWRGDGLEVNILHHLGRLKTENRQFLEGLQDLKGAVEIAKEHNEDPQPIKDDIDRTFRLIFDNPSTSPGISAIEAIAIFNEFKELIPSGAEGAQTMLRAADFMISIDLLDRAAVVLEDQMNNGYLAPSQITSTGTKLAAIYLLDKKPTDALRVLRNTDSAPRTDKQNIERILLSARAQSMLKRPKTAIETLANLNSPAAKRLKADIYWQHRQWKNAGDTMKTLLPNPQKKLSDTEAEMILQTAAAYKLAGDRLSLRQIKTTYSASMDQTEKASVFSVVTRDGGDSTLSDRTTTLKIAGEVDLFKDFMESFKKTP